MSPARKPTPGPWTELRLGARAHDIRTTDRPHTTTRTQQFIPDNADPALDAGTLHK